MEYKKRNLEQKIYQMKKNAIKDIKNISVRASIEAIEHLITNSIDKNKLEKLYNKSMKQVENSLKNTKA